KPSSTYDASGYGATRSGRPTSSGCSAPGISLFVQTTSGPKYGHSPVAEYRSPSRKICVSSSKKNSRERPNPSRKAKSARRTRAQRARTMPASYPARRRSLHVGELVADAPGGQDQLRILRLALDFFAQAADNGVDGALGHEHFVAPDL